MRLLLLVAALAACATPQDLVKPVTNVDTECEAWMKADDDLLQKVRADDKHVMDLAIFDVGLCLQRLQECKAQSSTKVDYR
jgi:hypothetical protein